MAFNKPKLVLVKSKAKTHYERWIEKEAVPVWRGLGISDIREVPLREWKRLNSMGAYFQLPGLAGNLGAYVCKIPPGGSLQPEKHLYEEAIYVLEGEGIAEIQQRGQVPRSFGWQAGSLFSPPLNATHRLMNYSDQPAFVLAVTTAPLVLDHFHNEDFVFNSDFAFLDRYAGVADYFERRGEHYLCGDGRQTVWETNFIRDVRTVLIDAPGQIDSNSIWLEMCDNTLVGRLSLWPTGKYQQARCENFSALRIMLRSEGYTLMWPRDCGLRPFENGCGSHVARVDWRPGSILSPPAQWFHQHFNTGPEPALQLLLGRVSRAFALRQGLEWGQPGFFRSPQSEPSPVIEDLDEDPQMRRLYDAELHRKGVTHNVAANES